MHRFVFFDAAGTLFRVKTSVGQVYADLARQFGIDRDPDLLSQAFLREFRSRSPLAFPPMPQAELEQKERAWWKALVMATFGGETRFEAFDRYFDRLYEAFAGPERWELFAETKPVLEQLVQQGVRLGVLSNFDSRLRRLLESLEIAPYFETVIISSMAGAAKPALQIFQFGSRQVGVPPAAVVHVGDSIEEDLLGAQSAGWTAFLLDRRQQHPEVPADRRIHTLADLLPKLSALSAPQR